MYSKFHNCRLLSNWDLLVCRGNSILFWNNKPKNFVLNLFLIYFFPILCNFFYLFFFIFFFSLFFLLRLHLTQQYFFLEPQEKNLRIQTLAKNVFVIVQLFFFFCFGRQVRTSTLKSEQV